MYRPSLQAAAWAAALLIGGSPIADSATAGTEVVASIKPVHSLVAGVMAGIGEPHLIVRGGGSPHGFAMRPSDARALASAGLVFWIGPDMEGFLDGPLDKLAGDATIVALGAAPGLTRLAVRDSGAWEGHRHDDDHGGHAHGKGRDHDDEDGHDDDHGQDDAHGPDDDHDHDDDHDDAMTGLDAGRAAGETDMHLWLDPENARAMVRRIASALAAADPDNAARYAANATAMDASLSDLQAELAAVLAPVRDRPFVQFHDAFQYLEARYGLNAVGSVTASPERRPGAERLAALRRKIADSGAVCIFAEPQFPPDLIDVVIEGSAVRTGTLDPLGADIPDGPGLYGTLMRRNTDALRRCLSPES